MRALHVFPMFGADLTNGSEQYTYHLSRGLARLPVQVQVVATQARELRQSALFSIQWRSAPVAATEEADGLLVHRFPVTLSLPALLGRGFSRLVWRRWQAELAQAGPLPTSGPE